jgi:hypothetical protein
LTPEIGDSCVDRQPVSNIECERRHPRERLAPHNPLINKASNSIAVTTYEWS